MLNLALGYVLALYLGNPFAHSPSAEKPDPEETAAAPSSEEIHEILSQQVGESPSAENAQPVASEPDSEPQVVQPPAEATAEQPAPVQEAVVTEPPTQTKETPAVPEASPPTANIDDWEQQLLAEAEAAGPNADSNKSTEQAEQAAPDIDDWERQLLAEAEAAEPVEQQPTPTEAPPIEERAATSEDPGQAGEQTATEDAVSAEAEVLAGIEAFRDQLAASLPGNQPTVQETASQTEEAANSEPVKVAEPRKDSNTASEELRAVSDQPVQAESVEAEAGPSEVEAEEADAETIGHVENVDADVMAGIEAFRNQLAAMRDD